MSITITDEMVDVAMAAGLGPRSPFVFDPVYVGFDLRAALATAAPLIEAAVREAHFLAVARGIPHGPGEAPTEINRGTIRSGDRLPGGLVAVPQEPSEAMSKAGAMQIAMNAQRVMTAEQKAWYVYHYMLAAIRADGGAE
jgi:hypothetical protein